MRLPRKLLAPCLALLFALAPPAPAHADELPPSPVGRAPFLWGVSLAGYQNDGGTPEMDWYDIERSGKVPEQSGKGPDFRGHMDADLDRAQSLGLNAFRTSIEWARLEPRPGYFDPQEVAYVHRLLKGIRSRGMTPIITLYHFATPKWVYQDDDGGLLGWENYHTVEAYWRYVEFVAHEFGAEIPYFLTINEPSTLVGGGYVLGWLAPHHAGPVSAMRAAANIVTAHIGAYERIHRICPDAMVSMPDYNSIVPVGSLNLPYTPGEWLSLMLDHVKGWDGQDRVKYLDFVALHYYGAVDTEAASKFPVEPYRWAPRPADFAEVLKSYYQLYHLPILVAENGFATDNGRPRADGWTRESYLVTHIQALQSVRAAGVPIMGYLYWTLTDNYEWGSYNPRFGLWSVDVRSGNLIRHPTPAVAVYREIIRHDGVTPALIKRYPPPPPSSPAPFLSFHFLSASH